MQTFAVNYATPYTMSQVWQHCATLLESTHDKPDESLDSKDVAAIGNLYSINADSIKSKFKIGDTVSCSNAKKKWVGVVTGKKSNQLYIVACFSYSNNKYYYTGESINVCVRMMEPVSLFVK